MDVYWLEQTEADVATGNAWLSPDELVRLNGMRFAKRRTDWRLGRWAAKRSLAVYLGLPALPQVFAKIEILPASSGAPEVFVAHEPAPVTISLSHRDGRAACAVAPSGIELGCDLEVIEPHSDAFISDYFTAEEHALVLQASVTDRSRLLALLWSAKESALKALHTGLRLDTRHVIVRPVEGCDLNGWSPLQVCHTGDRVFHGWWQRMDDHIVRTLVSDPPADAPIHLIGLACTPDRVSRCA